jgi:hypothetical protein
LTSSHGGLGRRRRRRRTVNRLSITGSRCGYEVRTRRRRAEPARRRGRRRRRREVEAEDSAEEGDLFPRCYYFSPVRVSELGLSIIKDPKRRHPPSSKKLVPLRSLQKSRFSVSFLVLIGFNESFGTGPPKFLINLKALT